MRYPLLAPLAAFAAMHAQAGEPEAGKDLQLRYCAPRAGAHWSSHLPSSSLPRSPAERNRKGKKATPSPSGTLLARGVAPGSAVAAVERTMR